MALTAAMLALALSGCVTEDRSCIGTSTDNRMTLEIQTTAEETDRLEYSFGCETEEHDHPIDRYRFLLAFPRTNVIELLPEPEEHAEGPSGEIVYYVHQGNHHRFWSTSEVPESGEAFYQVTFQDWQPGRERVPTITITWQPASGEEEDTALPTGGLYGIHVLLRTGSDRTRWTVVEY